MKKLILFLLLALVVAIPASASNDQHKVYVIGAVLTDVDLSGAAATRTFYVGPRVTATDYTDNTEATTGEQLRGFAKMAIEVQYSHNNNGVITTTCTASLTRAGTYSTPQTCKVSGGTCTLKDGWIMQSDATPSTDAADAFSGDANYVQYIGLNGEPAIKCVLSHGGTPDSSDTVTVNVWLIAD